MTHLWLVSPDDIVAALEEGEAGRSTQRRRLAHTNLSGGCAAHVGGELWFSDSTRVWLSGGSSRYEARSEDELVSIADAFRHSGYTISACGWDDEGDRPARIFRGPDSWLEAHG